MGGKTDPVVLMARRCLSDPLKLSTAQREWLFFFRKGLARRLDQVLAGSVAQKTARETLYWRKFESHTAPTIMGYPLLGLRRLDR